MTDSKDGPIEVAPYGWMIEGSHSLDDVSAAADMLQDVILAEALNAANVAVDAYYNGMQSDREWAERWLIKAHEANQESARQLTRHELQTLALHDANQNKGKIK